MKHTPTHGPSAMSVITMAAMLSVCASISASMAFTQAQVAQRSGPRIRQQIAVDAGVKKIPTCEEAGLCKGGQRLVFDAKNPRAVERLKERGCTVVHDLSDKTSLRCPRGITAHGARPERVFRSMDLTSATQMDVPAAWEQGVTGKYVRVAVLDTGVDAAHVELNGKIFVRQNFTGGSDADALGHGTHVAGIVSGLGLNAVDSSRAVGTATGAWLFVGKVCSDEGWCMESDILAGLEWAVAQKARVINLSLGGGEFDSHCDGDTLARKVNWAVEQGSVVVAAAGNTGNGVASPACASRAVAVGAVDRNDVRANWSGKGEALDIMAPGVSILSAYSCTAAGSCPGPWYVRMSGTSMAAPHVTGLVALILEKFPTLTPDKIHSVLTASAKDLGDSGYDALYGHGRVDADDALALARTMATDADKDGHPEGLDCDDADSAVYPGANESCNLKDDDCDGLTDEGFDADNDGISVCGGDCGDADTTVFPGAPELCNGKDDDCNGQMDDQCRFEGFCGDLICGYSESHMSCPLDCVLTNTEDVKTRRNPKTICGDGVCEGSENSKRCSVDCRETKPGNGGRGTSADGVQSTGNAGDSDNGGSGNSNGNGGGNSGNAGNGNGNAGGNGRGRSDD